MIMAKTAYEVLLKSGAAAHNVRVAVVSACFVVLAGWWEVQYFAEQVPVDAVGNENLYSYGSLLLQQ